MKRLGTKDASVGNYKDDLEKAGVQGQRTEDGKYIRFMKSVDVSDPESKQSILNLVDVFNRQVLRVAVDPMPEEGTPVASFLDELKQISCVHFM